MKILKSFETPFFGLKMYLAVSMTFLHSNNTIFREKDYVSCFLKLGRFFGNIAILEEIFMEHIKSGSLQFQFSFDLICSLISRIRDIAENCSSLSLAPMYLEKAVL